MPPSLHCSRLSKKAHELDRLEPSGCGGANVDEVLAGPGEFVEGLGAELRRQRRPVLREERPQGLPLPPAFPFQAQPEEERKGGYQGVVVAGDAGDAETAGLPDLPASPSPLPSRVCQGIREDRLATAASARLLRKWCLGRDSK